MISDYVIFSVLAVFLLVVIIAAYVVRKTPEATEFETQKIRFAAVTFTGIMVLVLITAILGVYDSSPRGMEIFKTVMTGLSPIAGGIIGYLFSAKSK